MFLNCHSYYSLRYGMLSMEQLVQQAVEKKVEILALTDINNSTGVFDFVKECNAHHIKPVVGTEFRNGYELLFIGLARNNRGFYELNEWLTKYLHSKEDKPNDAPAFNQVYIIYPLSNIPGRPLRDNEWIGVKGNEVNRLVNRKFKKYLKRMVVLHPVSFYNVAMDYEVHRMLRAVNLNTLLSKLPPEAQAESSEFMCNPEALKKYYVQYPQIISNTENILNDCSFSFDFKTIKNRKTFTGSRYDDKLLLEKLLQDGLEYRYGLENREAEKRLWKELEIIDRLGFTSYFLITWDVIRYSMSRGFYHVGRGSGANSIAAYCLRITDVDPIELDLYFERFINPSRTSPPDFDIDYSWKERDDVLDYIFKRYGKEYTAFIGTISTFKGKSIIREFSKIFGLPKSEIDDLVRNPLEGKNQTAVFNKIVACGKRITDFPNLRSVHSGGVVISDEPLFAYTALDLPPKNFATTQFDMYIAEDIGFEKLDILSQRGIGHIKECADLVYQNQKTRIDVHDVKRFKEDPQVRKQLKSGDTIGCFYVESPAMRGLLKKLRCDNYISLVAASSIIRPGVAKSGMMREYIHRFHHPDDFEYLHPIMEKLLEETYGVMVYQEDVIKVAHHFAGLSLSEADVLRRAMSGKFRSKKEMNRIVEKFFFNCKTKGYPDKLTNEVWRQIESFAGYSFSKAHSASYAVESYQSLFLKAHYPLEFMTAVINNFGGFYRTWVYVHEARMGGANIQNPCVNYSRYTTTIYGDIIYLGFIHLHSFESKHAKLIPAERKRNGPFRSLEDFLNRVPITLDQLIILIRVGAFRFTSLSKKELLWDAHLLLGHEPKRESSASLFEIPNEDYELPPLTHDKFEDAYEEIELIGFPVSCSHFNLQKQDVGDLIYKEDMHQHIGKTVRMVGDLVTLKYVTTVRRELMIFGTFFDGKGKFFDTTHFPPSLKQYPFEGRGLYVMQGKVAVEFGFCSLEVNKMKKLELVPDPRYAEVG